MPVSNANPDCTRARRVLMRDLTLSPIETVIVYQEGASATRATAP